MTQQSAFFVLEGGLDQTTQAIAMPKGRAIAVSNHESVQEGYARVDGFERFDGRASPTEAGEAVSDDATAARAARDAARALIGAVPGSGPVRGVWWFDGALYAFRDNVGATEGIMYRSSGAGWQVVGAGYSMEFDSGGTVELLPGDTIVGATSAATAEVWAIKLLSGTWAAGDAAGLLIVSDPVGTFAATENLNRPGGGGMNIASKSGPISGQQFPPGGRYQFITHNFYGAANLRRAYGVNGVGQAFEIQAGGGVVFIDTGMPDDRPTRIAAYKQHLFLAFPGGSVQYSDVGEPVVWNPTLGGVGEIGMGDEVTDFISDNQNSLTILCASSVAALVGSDSDDFALQPLTDEAGAIAWTAQRVGAAIYMDNRGVRSISATSAYGNFKLGSLTQQIQKTLDQKRKAGIKPTASITVRTKGHYRAFYDDGTGISLFFGRKSPEAMLFDFARPVTCICSVDDPGGSERIFFGSDNGFVYEMDKGTSFDGEPIEAHLQLAYNHEGSPYVLKKWARVELELVARPGTQIKMFAEYDYSGTEQASTAEQTFDVAGGGGLWGIATWADFYWSSPNEGQAKCWIDGQGQNMSPIVVSVSDDQPGYVLQGVRTVFSGRGRLR